MAITESFSEINELELAIAQNRLGLGDVIMLSTVKLEQQSEEKRAEIEAGDVYKVLKPLLGSDRLLYAEQHTTPKLSVVQ